jgi:hypothetical protein
LLAGTRYLSKPTYILGMVQLRLVFVLQYMVACIAIIVVMLATQTVADGPGFTGTSLVAHVTFGEILNYIIRWWAQLENWIGAITRLKALNDEIPKRGPKMKQSLYHQTGRLRAGLR